METWEAWLTVIVAGSLLVCLAMRVAATDLLALLFLGVVMLAQEISGSPLLPTAEEAVAGFGNKGLITVALLFAVVAGLEFTGGTELATSWLLCKAKNVVDAKVRLLLPVAALSGFLNNTPLVAALMPVVGDLSKRVSVNSSRLLLPLSYAAILGGMCTIMGTSTNLIIKDKYEQLNGNAMSFFEPAAVGIPAAIVGLLYIILCSRWLLPERQAAVSATDDPRQYTVEMEVSASGPLVGRTLKEAGLRHLPGLYVAEIQRADGTIAPAKPTEILRGDDVLILVGALDSVVDMRKIRGLTVPDGQARKLRVPSWQRTLVEAVVSSRCALLGKTIREGKFRSHYNAAVVAVARGERRLTGKIGDVRLEVGDVLLLEASPSFLHRRRQSHDFFLVSTVEKGEVRRPELAWLSLAVMLAMVIAATLSPVSIMTAALIAAIAMIVLRCCSAAEARRSIDWSVLIVIGAAIGIGQALEQSGAADAIANGLLSIAGGGNLRSLAAIFIATMICTELITNNAAAVLMFTIAVTTAGQLGVDPAPFVIAVMIAASASFLTPVGYQTNTMVYGVGGYRFSDYLRFGLPLSAIVFAVSMVIIPQVWPFTPTL
ncbi:MAG: SLC13 family permease [Novipirellula sp. JB048]